MDALTRGWVNYPGATEKAALLAALDAAVERADNPEYARAVAANWRFVEDPFPAGGYCGHFAFWVGTVRAVELPFVRAQVEAVAAALEPEVEWLPDGRTRYELQGLFDVSMEGERPREWRLYGRAVHEHEREVPPWEEPGGLDTGLDVPLPPPA
ncbi:MAG TPA: hypothetical protein VF594_06115 [Rubricoccaceae bacterium]